MRHQEHAGRNRSTISMRRMHLTQGKQRVQRNLRGKTECFFVETKVKAVTSAVKDMRCRNEKQRERQTNGKRCQGHALSN